MNHALFVHEILRIIFHYVWVIDRPAAWKPSRHRIPTLAALARTCQAFKEVALDALWLNLDDLSPLIRCLPRDSWTMSYPLVSFYGLTSPLSEEEWLILRGYARRIRIFGSWNAPLKLDKTTTRMLCYPPTAEPLFPNIQRLDWADERRETFSFIRHLLGPKTTTLSIRVWDASWGTGELAVLASLKTLCPDVRAVTLPTSDNAHIHSIVSEVLCSWTKLTSVTCHTINESALLHLGGLRSLETLSFKLDPRALGSSMQPLPDKFLNLSSLSVTSARLEDIRVLMLRLHWPLADLQVTVDRCPSHHEIRAFFTALKTSCNPDHLVAVAIDQVPTTPSDRSPTFTLTIDDFSPLTCFGNFCSLHLDTGCPIQLNGEDIMQLAGGWPRLETLSLNYVNGWRSSSGIAPLDLAKLVVKCSRLKTLDVMLNTKGFKKIPRDRPSGGFSLSPLWSLEVLDSKIEPASIGPLAALLSDLFPKLRDLGSWRSESMAERPRAEEYMDRWSEVRGLVEQFAAVRTQERRFKDRGSDSKLESMEDVSPE
ncbi:hypothetical protein HYDPIDRAFT_92752 [Hydnomerulius pinastri MD-312]|uniref:F-box domain-containing protein n=1 Tax=Hydnomerulius pinastri MD-312 TaxID=994086 RepID=A0A0C9W7W0_9AGAM|nr:hypothetical protein HYDPIDRAFT_92752 [Hydnomerulius pinastri MD-312]